MAAITSASTSSAAAAASKLTLKSKVDPSFTVEVDSRVVEACSILRNVTEHTDNSDAVEVDMTPNQLKQFVELHEHFDSATAEKDTEWTNEFFGKMSEDEFKDLSWKADFLDSQRFLEAAGDFTLHKLENMEVSEIQRFLNIVDDYTPEERKAMEEHPLEFFTGVSVQQDDTAAAQDA